MADVYLGEKTMTYYSEHKEERDAYQRRWVKEHPNFQKERYARIKEKEKLRHADYYLENKEQYNERERNYYEQNKEKVRARVKRYYAKNREEISRKWHEKHPLKEKVIRTEEERKIRTKNNKLFREFGITLEDYDQMRFEQDRCCAICGRHEDEFPLHQLFVDHDHNAGKVRKLLCNNCNSILGHARDDINVLYKAIAYLKLFR